jgi:hypothetical protein
MQGNDDRLYVVEIYLPLYSNSGKRFQKAVYAAVASELTERFGGITAYVRSPAIGLWRKPGERRSKRDDIVVYEVMAARLNKKWWTDYRRKLEHIFEQEALVIRAHGVRLL